MTSRPKRAYSKSNEEVTSFISKRKRSSSTNLEYESSTESFTYSNYILSESEGNSDSEFEDHSYSKLGPSKSASRPKSDLRFNPAQLEQNTGRKKRSKCTSKNAVNARLNRLKKKIYIKDLEEKNAKLKSENRVLVKLLESRNKEVEYLKKRTLNLESVIRNKTVIGSLLKCVQEHTNLDISSSLIRKQNYQEEKTRVEEPSTSLNVESEVSPENEEALVAAVLALHTLCHLCKLWPNFKESI